MKEITKDNKGITLVALIITIILMLILTSVTTYTGINTYKSMQVTKFVAQMQLIQGKVDELKENKTIEELLAMGEDVPSDKGAIITAAYNDKGEITSNDISAYRYFSSKNLKQELELDDGIDGEIMINFTTREVVSTNGIKYENEMYYTQYLLPNAQTVIQYNPNNALDRDLYFNIDVIIDGLNATVQINGNETVEVDGIETLEEKGIEIANATLSYREQGDTYWKTITNYTEKGKVYSVLISKSATYEFKLTDNTTGEESSEVTETLLLTNKPKTDTQIDLYNYSLTSENWAYSIDTEGNNYVWIPRLAINNNNQSVIKFLKGNSNITTDNLSINEDSWTIPDKFTSADRTKLTGIWVKVSSKNQQGINIVELINSNITILTEL